MNAEWWRKYGDPEEFPVGTRVEVQPCWEDFRAIQRGLGTVVKNEMRYLGIVVEFDVPQVVYRDDPPGGIRRWDFHPMHLRHEDWRASDRAPEILDREQE
jgi:hypothetical protein